MKMNTPLYWKEKNLKSYLLKPFGAVYGFITGLRVRFQKPKHVNIPVVCIGNLTAGGSGKTPVALSVMRLMKKKYRNPMFVSRGYGGKLKDIMVNRQEHTAEQVGDEPLLLSRLAPTIINPNRYKAAEKAFEEGADAIVMDDGFQNQTLVKDLSFLVFDGEAGIGNGFCLPAGPMREKFEEGIKRADAVIILGEDKSDIQAEIVGIPVFHGKVLPVSKPVFSKNVIAFAGIGRPQKFYDSLLDFGADLIATRDFPDHHKYKEEELLDLIDFAKSTHSDLYTTTKDYVKIPYHLRAEFKVLEVGIKWQEESKLIEFICSRLF